MQFPHSHKGQLVGIASIQHEIEKISLWNNLPATLLLKPQTAVLTTIIFLEQAAFNQCNIAFEARPIQCEMKWRCMSYLVSLSIIDKMFYFSLSKIIQWLLLCKSNLLHFSVFFLNKILLISPYSKPFCPSLAKVKLCGP